MKAGLRSSSIRKIILFFSILFLWTCGGGGGDKATGPEEPPIVINLTSLGGQAQKGPFNNGTAINVAELTSALSPTGRNFSSAITDNTGRFSVANVQLESPYVELRANGYYFNEVSNEISSGQLTLFALSNLTGKSSLNVNIITHLEKNRMTTLMSGDNPQTFAQAKNNAQEAVFAIFDYSRANVPESELLDISQGGAANGKLLAMSAILQGDLTVGQMSELLANISTDIAADGTLDDASLRATLINNSKNLDMTAIRANLVTRYASLGISATIPDFETEINQFLKPPVVQDMSLSTDEDTSINITLTGSDPEGESITYNLVDDSNNATVTISGNVANYVPNAHFNGTDTFTYKANDGTSDSNIGTVTITVNAIDDDPNTNDVSATTDEDTAVDISLTADEYDGQNYSFGIIANPSNGTVSLSGTTATYTPNQDWNGTDTFTFEATDDRIMFGKRNVATATITVNAINDAPTSSEVSGSSNEDTAIDVALSATDVDQDNLTYSIVSDVSNGTTSISGSTLTYTPNQDWNGTDTFTYKVNDGTVDSNTSNGTITIAAVNDAPVANDVTLSTNETRFISVDITLDGTDVEGDNLTYTIVSDASNATTSLSGNIVTYVPTTDWNGEDSFTYKANDGTVDSNTATVTITVNAVNDAPVASALSVSTNEDTAKTITLSATDVEGSSLTYKIVSYPSINGISTFNASDAPGDGVITYTPPANWNGTETFTYKANDGTEDGNTATVTITVAAVNDAPVANDMTVSTNETRFSSLDIALDVTDVDGDDLTYTIVSDASNATTTLSNNVITYVPTTDWNGSDSFTYKANDGTVDSNTATVTITVNAVNDIPVASTLSVSTNEDTEITIDSYENYTGSNPYYFTVTDVENDQTDVANKFTYSIVSNPSNGSLDRSVGTYWNTSVSYTPNENWNGTDTFTYKANDGTDDSNTATVTVTVAAVNDLPIATGNGLTINEDASGSTFTMSGTDVDGDDLIRILTVVPSNGDAYNDAGGGNPDGSALAVGDTLASVFTIYNPDANWNGTDIIEFKVNDGTADSPPLALNLVVNPVNDIPIMTTQTITINEDIPTDITLSATDVDGDNLTYRILTVDNGSTSISGSTVTYTPPANLNGANADIIFWVANDGTSDGINSESGASESKVFISINAVNDAPIANNTQGDTTIDEDATGNGASPLTLKGTDVDNDDSSLIRMIVSPPANGNTYNAASGNVPDGNVLSAGDTLKTDLTMYTPSANYNGTDTFTYKVNDGALDSAPTTVTMTVHPVNDAPVANDHSFTEDEDTASTNTLTATDIDGDNLTYSLVSAPSAGGTVVVGTNTEGEGWATFTPTANWNGTTTFTYKANDGTVDSNTATVTFAITAVQDAPTTNDVSASTNEDIAVDNITLDGSDVDTGDTLTYSIVSDASNGSTSLSGSTVTYTPDADWYGTDTFTYKANDGTDDSNTSTVTVTVTSIPEHTIYPDLTSGYDEFFSDIVYDKSTGGYSVGGFTRNTGDSGSGGTWAMTYLATNADLSSTTRYETVSTTLGGGITNINNARDGSVHFFDISERSTDGGFVVSKTNDYLWAITSSATATYVNDTSNLDGTYKWMDYVQASYQTSDGGYLIVAKVKTQDGDDQYPVIAKTNASLSVQYFKVLTNHATTASLTYVTNEIEFVKDGFNDNTYYLAAETSVSGISGTNAIQYYKISDGGSSFTVDQYVNLSDIANSPTQIVSEGTSIDAMVYMWNGRGEFAIITNGGNGQQLTKYHVDETTGSATIEGVYDLSNYSNYMEILVSSTAYIYIVVTSGDDIKVIQLADDSFNENWSRTLDITGLGYRDKLGGATATGFGIDGNGSIAITGSTKNDDDWDGFIVIVDDAGNRIY